MRQPQLQVQLHCIKQRLPEYAKDNETRQFWEREHRRWALVLIARRHSPPSGMGWVTATGNRRWQLEIG